MAETNVKVMPGCRSVVPELQDDVIEVLEWLLVEAKDGRLQSFVGVGISIDGTIKRAFCPSNNFYTELGALQQLVHLYCVEHDRE